MIPKIIHQTWKDENIPERWKDAVQSVQNLQHLGYVYVLWTDDGMEAFMKENYPDFVELYQSYPHHIQRCDVFRYFVLYKYGGIYLDMDIECKKDLSDFLNYDLVLTNSSNISSSATNSFFMASVENEFIKYCIDHLDEYKDAYSMFGQHFHIMKSTGPMFLGTMISNYGRDNLENTYFLSSEEWAGDCNACSESDCNGGTYFRHIPGNSWHSWDSTIYNVLMCKYKYIVLIILLSMIVWYTCSSKKKKGKK